MSCSIILSGRVAGCMEDCVVVGSKWLANKWSSRANTSFLVGNGGMLSPESDTVDVDENSLTGSSRMYVSSGFFK